MQSFTTVTLLYNIISSTLLLLRSAYLSPPNVDVSDISVVRDEEEALKRLFQLRPSFIPRLTNGFSCSDIQKEIGRSAWRNVERVELLPW